MERLKIILCHILTLRCLELFHAGTYKYKTVQLMNVQMGTAHRSRESLDGSLLQLSRHVIYMTFRWGLLPTISVFACLSTVDGLVLAREYMASSESRCKTSGVLNGQMAAQEQNSIVPWLGMSNARTWSVVDQRRIEMRCYSLHVCPFIRVEHVFSTRWWTSDRRGN